MEYELLSQENQTSANSLMRCAVLHAKSRVQPKHRARPESHSDSMQVFTEAEIRASVVFQLSKLVTLLLKAARLNTGAGAWDAIVAGGLKLLP